MSKKSLWVIIIIAFLVIIIFLSFLLFTVKLTHVDEVKSILDVSLKDTIRFEFIKSLLQLFGVILVGSIITYFFKLQEEDRRNAFDKEAEIRKEDFRLKEEEHKESKIKASIRIDYFKRLGSVYRNVKYARRVLRTGGLTSKFNNALVQLSPSQLTLYLEQMEEVNKAQLELEELKIEAKSLPAFVSLDAIIGSEEIKVIGSIKIMEKYLREILSEFEAFSPLLTNNQDVNFLRLERLNEFTGSTSANFRFQYGGDKKYRFKTNFSTPYANIIKIIGKNIG